VDMLPKFIAPGIAFLLTLAFGVWLSHSGKPYNGILFNIHKLIALGAAILTAGQLFRVLKDTGIQVVPILLIVIAVACVVALFATGALMSMEKMSYQVTLTIHRLAPILAVIAMAVTVYLLAGRKP
jgi:uncharacterized membrane protein YadS